MSTNVAFISAEVSPYAKSGELADFAGSLPKYLSNLGLKVSIFLPKYRRPEIDSLSMTKVASQLYVPVGKKSAKTNIYKTDSGKHELYFVDNPKYFLRENIYGTGKGEYLDNDERFIYFNRAILEFIHKKKMHFDIIHCNNWPTALIPVFLKTHYAKKKHLNSAASILTLHNISYQGEFPAETLALTGLNWDCFINEKSEFNGKVNFLKAGIMFSDVVNTVSHTYKKEILTKQRGCGLANILKERKKTFFSIRNGIDHEIWNPETDPYIAKNYSRSEIEKKEENKLDLLKEFGDSLSPKSPAVGIASFLTPYKGFDILFSIMDKLMTMDMTLLILGKGDEQLKNKISSFQKKHPKKIAAKFQMGPNLIHKIIAGSDIFLIPSLYEPCGLHQLYCFRYGTVPVVRATGGLRETVKPFNKKDRTGNGFIFEEYSPKALLNILKEVFNCYKNQNEWKQIMKAGMMEKFSMENSAKKYVKLYKKALALKKGGNIE
ncbi:MAG: glycogen synthase [Candidatus Aminicenantaceae bacterium]